MDIKDYAKIVDARDKAQQEYFKYKRTFKAHSSELYQKARELENQEREATKQILEESEEPSLF